MSSLAQGSSASVIKFLREQKIKQEQDAQKKAQQAEEQTQQQEKRREEMREAEEIADYLFSVHGNGTWKLSNNDAAARPHLQRAIMNGHRKRRQARQQALLNSKKAATEAATAEAELAKEVERQRIIVRNEEERKSKEEEIARLRVSLRPRVEEDVLKMIVQGHLPSSIKLTGNKKYMMIYFPN